MVDNQPGPSVQYTGAHWYHRTGDKESENCFDATASHWRRTAPSGGNVTFTFVGTSLSIYGGTRPDGKLEGDVSFNATYEGRETLCTVRDRGRARATRLCTTADSTEVKQRTYTIHSLPPDVYLDYFAYTTEIGGLAGDTHHQPQTDVGESTSAPSAESSCSCPSKDYTGVIAGCVIGGFVFVAGLVWLAMMLRRRLRRRQTEKSGDVYYPPQPIRAESWTSLHTASPDTIKSTKVLPTVALAIEQPSLPSSEQPDRLRPQRRPVILDSTESGPRQTRSRHPPTSSTGAGDPVGSRHDRIANWVQGISPGHPGR
ncbi:hypothetical protein BDV98DRAFT_593715 [Pterulicium gracile]|uniref:Uncharacterized protein n=1 Tax=Pterulicium gracile TaxID=1884261 RepID=A0A5C3QHW3_9AGAR|nr:hypothetical protein BDV98DRAFT_593715 [Pterula gracilis]